MTIALPRFQQAAALVDARGNPTSAFHIWWDTFARKLEATLTDLSDVQADILAVQADQAAQLVLIQDAQADIVAAQADIVAAQADIVAVQADQAAQLAQIIAAQATADAAQTKANTVSISDKISASATVPSIVLSASDAGTDATITIAAHTRIYGDSTTVTVGSPVNITGLAYSTTYGIYYDDATATTTTPSYFATTVLSNAMPNYTTGRHFVGQVTTPAAGGGSTSGGITPPGGGGPYP